MVLPRRAFTTSRAFLPSGLDLDHHTRVSLEAESKAVTATYMDFSK